MADSSQMLANILEQPIVADRTLALDLAPPSIADITQITFAACGTSRHAALVARFWWQQWLDLPIGVEDASDWQPTGMGPNHLVYLLSQSGQTRDVMDVAAAGQAATLWGMTNGSETALHQVTRYILQTPAGEEKAVAATKTFLSQLLLLLRLGLALAKASNPPITTELATIPTQIQATLQLADRPCQTVAAKLAQSSRVILLGAGINTPIALEGALKLKETAYLHAEGLASGDFMHGPIAIIEPGFPVITIAIPDSPGYAKTIAQAQRVKSYGAYLVGITTEDSPDAGIFDVVLPIAPVSSLLSPLLTVLPLQLLAYYTALQKGLDIDAPRNLTKFIG
jgi:glucosamine 6-phosphate synthetase-like amidotransferase/phosphosugar isomerase protein